MCLRSEEPFKLKIMVSFILFPWYLVFTLFSCLGCCNPDFDPSLLQTDSGQIHFGHNEFDESLLGGPSANLDDSTGHANSGIPTTRNFSLKFTCIFCQEMYLF